MSNIHNHSWFGHCGTERRTVYQLEPVWLLTVSWNMASETLEKSSRHLLLGEYMEGLTDLLSNLPQDYLSVKAIPTGAFCLHKTLHATSLRFYFKKWKSDLSSALLPSSLSLVPLLLKGLPFSSSLAASPNFASFLILSGSPRSLHQGSSQTSHSKSVPSCIKAGL